MAKEYEHSNMTDDLDHCYLCGRERVQFHHVLGKYDRKKCTEDGLFIPVCLECHIKIHNERSQQLNHKLKQEAQWIYEQTHDHGEWVKRYGRNYL